jgi:murein DD-endopeptidase MepM/ murein hydrolase activator NlpD
VAGRPPERLVIARLPGLDLRLPVDRGQVTAIAFRAVDDPNALALAPGDGIDHRVAPSDGRAGADTSGVDVGAPATAPVYAPVDGMITAVTPYLVSGRQEGYQVAIAPTVAAGMVVTLNHLEAVTGRRPPSVGHPVQAGVTVLGRVRDFTGVVKQEISRYTSDSGNHVHIEVLRTGSDQAP